MPRLVTLGRRVTRSDTSKNFKVTRSDACPSVPRDGADLERGVVRRLDPDHADGVQRPHCDATRVTHADIAVCRYASHTRTRLSVDTRHIREHSCLSTRVSRAERDERGRGARERKTNCEVRWIDVTHRGRGGRRGRRQGAALSRPRAASPSPGRHCHFDRKVAAMTARLLCKSLSTDRQ